VWALATGAAAVMQIKATGSYVAPSIPMIELALIKRSEAHKDG
jgi:hypothetical protein